MEIGCEVRDTDAGTKTRLPFIGWFVSNAGHDRKSNKHQNGERSLGYILMKRRRLLLFGRLLMIKMRSNHTWPFCVWGLVKSIHKHCVRPFIPVLLIEYSLHWEKIREVSLGPCADGQAKSVSEMHALVRATTGRLVSSQRRGSCFSKACLKSCRSLSLTSETAP